MKSSKIQFVKKSLDSDERGKSVDEFNDKKEVYFESELEFKVCKFSLWLTSFLGNIDKEVSSEWDLESTKDFSRESEESIADLGRIWFR